MTDRANEIPSIKRTTLIVRDIDKARAFYRDVIGMTVWFDRPYTLGGMAFPGTRAGDKTHLVIMQAQDPLIGKIGLLQFTDPALPPAPLPETMGIGGVVFVAEVADVEALYGRVVAAGARVTSAPHDFEVVGATGQVQRYRSISFFDPDGNLFEANQRRED